MQDMNELITKTCFLSAPEAADKLQQILASRQIRLFARISHSAAAKESGLELPFEELFIFGDPKVGTALMQENAALGIELPLKILIWQAEQTVIGYQDPAHLAGEYSINQNVTVLEKMSQLLASLVDAVANVEAMKWH